MFQSTFLKLIPDYKQLLLPVGRKVLTKLQSLFCEERTIEIQQNIAIIFCGFNLHVQFNYMTWHSV